MKSYVETHYILPEDAFFSVCRHEDCVSFSHAGYVAAGGLGFVISFKPEHKAKLLEVVRALEHIEEVDASMRAQDREDEKTEIRRGMDADARVDLARGN